MYGPESALHCCSSKANTGWMEVCCQHGGTVVSIAGFMTLATAKWDVFKLMRLWMNHRLMNWNSVQCTKIVINSNSLSHRGSIWTIKIFRHIHTLNFFFVFCHKQVYDYHERKKSAVVQCLYNAKRAFWCNADLVMYIPRPSTCWYQINGRRETAASWEWVQSATTPRWRRNDSGRILCKN